jgi:hypothetical protein
VVISVTTTMTGGGDYDRNARVQALHVGRIA